MKYSIVGIIIWICAAIYWFFEKISSVVPQIDLDIFTIEAIFGLEWLESIPWPQLRPAAETIATTHVSLLMLAVGLVFIVIGMFFKT